MRHRLVVVLLSACWVLYSVATCQTETSSIEQPEIAFGRFSRSRPSRGSSIATAGPVAQPARWCAHFPEVDGVRSRAALPFPWGLHDKPQIGVCEIISLASNSDRPQPGCRCPYLVDGCCSAAASACTGRRVPRGLSLITADSSGAASGSRR